MTKGITQPLDSYRLTEISAPVPCYICESSNTHNAEFCHDCAAPMALAHQARNQKLHPRMIATIGPSAVGKTVYLGMLMDMLSRQPDRMHLLARGAFSITLQQTTVAALARCQFPRKTPNEPDRWNWVHSQIHRRDQPVPLELIMPDMAGEAILEEVDHPHSYRVIRAFLEKCAGALILVDAIKLKEGSLEQDFFTMKLLTYLSELVEAPRNAWSNRPVGIVFSKADQCEECMRDPTAFAEKHAKGMTRQCLERFPKHKFFAAGVAGACAFREIPGEPRVRVPLRVEPRGIVEPFEWILDYIDV